METVKDSGFPPGTVVIPAAFLPRYYEFMDALGHLQVPRGTISRLCRSCYISVNLNWCVERMEGDWCWFIDDDNAFSPDILMKLLAHAYRPSGPVIDVVMAIAPIKTIPFHPLIMHGPHGPGMPFYRWREVSAPGLFALPKGDFTGRAGMLVKRHVLDEIGYPWFKCGQFDPSRPDEDLWFCKELQELGYTIWIDRDLVMDHIFYFTLRAKRDENGVYHPAIETEPLQVNLHDLDQVVERGEGKQRILGQFSLTKAGR